MEERGTEWGGVEGGAGVASVEEGGGRVSILNSLSVCVYMYMALGATAEEPHHLNIFPPWHLEKPVEPFQIST